MFLTCKSCAAEFERKRNIEIEHFLCSRCSHNLRSKKYYNSNKYQIYRDKHYKVIKELSAKWSRENREKRSEQARRRYHLNLEHFRLLSRENAKRRRSKDPIYFKMKASARKNECLLADA